MAVALALAAALCTADAGASNAVKINLRGIPSAHAKNDTDSAHAYSNNTANLVDLAKQTAGLSTLASLLTAADLVGTLSGPGPFTVFAPANDAFAALPADELEFLKLPENKAALAELLRNHVAGGEVSSDRLLDGETLKTLEGDSLEARVGPGGIRINQANITAADKRALNGVIHIIDGVLLSPEFSTGATVTTAVTTTTASSPAAAAASIEPPTKMKKVASKPVAAPAPAPAAPVAAPPAAAAVAGSQSGSGEGEGGWFSGRPTFLKVVVYIALVLAVLVVIACCGCCVVPR